LAWARWPKGYLDFADVWIVIESEVEATPYKIGSSVSSVEFLLDARTAAEGAVGLASRQLATATRIDGGLEVVGVVPGPADWPEAAMFVAEARSGVLGALFAERATIVFVGDLIMGGRGMADDREPSELELELFTQRFLNPVSVFFDAIAPNRPAPIALIQRDYPSPARSMVVELTLTHQDESRTLLIEVLAHHVADDAVQSDSSTMEAVCEDVPLELTFAFDSVQLPAQEVAALQPGDVICLEHETDDPVIGRVGGKSLVRGRVGTSRRRVAIEVIDLVDGSE